MLMKQFDLVIIGAGPGGYVAAIRAAQLGMNVACIEKRGSLGGTCLNVGCIPSKVLLESSEKYHQANHVFKEHGINFNNLELDLSVMMKRKENVVDSLCKGIEGLFKKNKITYLKGHAKIIAPGTIKIDDKEEIMANNIIIATGSEVATLAGITIDEKQIVSSTGALSLSAVPKKIIVIGGGYIGLEMASVWNRLGAQVTVVEYLDKIVPAMDAELAKMFQKTLTKQGINFALGEKVLSATYEKNQVALEIENVLAKTQQKIIADIVLVAVGRKPHTDNLGLDEIGVFLDERGRIKVDAHFQTNIANIYAIGDVIAGPMLAHKAEEEGVAVVEIINKQKPHINYNTIPSVIYTHPEVASVGKTEEELKAQAVDYKVGKFPFLANSRARAAGESDGMVKILANAQTDEILGVHIMAPQAGTMIAEAVVAMEYAASSEDIARICHAHPTLNEAIKEAALAVSARAIHI
jgi:dihydrolipoamide dehydrogenase